MKKLTKIFSVAMLSILLAFLCTLSTPFTYSKYTTTTTTTLDLTFNSNKMSSILLSGAPFGRAIRKLTKKPPVSVEVPPEVSVKTVFFGTTKEAPKLPKEWPFINVDMLKKGQSKITAYWDAANSIIYVLTTENTLRLNSDCREMFVFCRSVETIVFSPSVDTTTILNTNHMFYSCTQLSRIYVSPEKWNMTKVTNSTEMFDMCNNLAGYYVDDGGTEYTYECDGVNNVNKNFAKVCTETQPGYLTDIKYWQN